MSGSILCVLALISTVLAGLRNWRYSFAVLLTWGYFHGVLKAQYSSSYGHFIFDGSTIGFYLGLFLNPPSDAEKKKWGQILPWLVVLTLWPIFVAIIPIQHYLVQAVGLRGNVFWLPMILIGSMLDRSGIKIITFSMALLNVFSFGIALAEYFIGVEYFVPENEVTSIVYNSNDIAGGHKRIPSTFTNAHSYAGTMVGTVPWLVGYLFESGKSSLSTLGEKLIVSVGLLAAALGVFIAGPRSPVAILGFLLFVIFFSSRFNFTVLLVVLVCGTVVAYLVSINERMQRFTELQDLDLVKDRLSVSMNMTFFQVLADYPMGNGMGAGGTNMPFFVQSLMVRPVVIENEYGRILLEQGIVGLILFLAFVFWFLTRKISPNDSYNRTKVLLWFLSAIYFATAWIGIGIMTTIPNTVLFLLSVGFCCTKEFGWRERSVGVSKLNSSSTIFLPAFQRGLQAANLLGKPS